MSIGIDLGTTNSVVAFYNKDHPEVIENEDGDRITPSFVYFNVDGSTIVGTNAKNNNVPQNGIFDVKRLLGKSFDEISGNMQNYPFKLVKNATTKTPLIQVELDNDNNKIKLYSPEEISSLVLTKLKQAAIDKLGESFTSSAVITVPAYFNHAQREATKKSAELAGLNVLQLLNEPTAAALSFIHQSSTTNETIVVFDFGGGTFDISLIKIEGRRISVKAIDGDSFLGGKDIDDVLVAYILQKIQSEYGVNVSDHRRALRRIRNCCQDVKVRLSSTETTELSLDYLLPEHESLSFTVTRELFNLLNAGIFNRTMELLNKCLVKNGMHASEVDQVILIGGSSRIPKIEQLLNENFTQAKICKSVCRDEAVALGAAVYAATLTSDLHSYEIENFELIDVLSYSLGVNIKGEQMSFILKKNDVLPAENTKKYVTIKDGQTYMKLRIYEGEDEYIFMNSQLGELLIEGLTEAPKGKVAVNVTFQVDSNGILNVFAIQLDNTDNRNELTISLRNRYD